MKIATPTTLKTPAARVAGTRRGRWVQAAVSWLPEGFLGSISEKTESYAASCEDAFAVLCGLNDRRPAGG